MHSANLKDSAGSYYFRPPAIAMTQNGKLTGRIRADRIHTNATHGEQTAKVAPLAPQQAPATHVKRPFEQRPEMAMQYPISLLSSRFCVINIHGGCPAGYNPIPLASHKMLFPQTQCTTLFE